MKKLDKIADYATRCDRIESDTVDRKIKLERWQHQRDTAYAHGFRATPQQLKKMLDELLDAGEICQGEYDLGMELLDMLDPEPVDVVPI